MWILLTAVATASLLGSMHCVGMCGPLAMWASGVGEQSPRHRIITATVLYHLGRMVTYMLAGLLAGLIGGVADFGGEILGVQMVAAKLVGGMMIIIGAYQLWPMLFRRSTAAVSLVAASKGPSLMSRMLLRLRPYVLRLPLAARGWTTGLLTALLPCGWLYLFALVAAGTASVAAGPLVMLAFWLGTVPVLAGLVAGSQTLAYRFRRLVPAVAALLLIVGGCYTAAGRGFAQLTSLAEIQPNSPLLSDLDTTQDSEELNEGLAGEVEQIVSTPLPCCEHREQDPEP